MSSSALRGLSVMPRPGTISLQQLALLLLLAMVQLSLSATGQGVIVDSSGNSSLLPKRRMRFVASTNRGATSFQPLANAFIQHNTSYNVASAYCSSPGPFDANSSLPDPPFCWDNWTVPIRAALPSVVHLPIIQLLGNSAPLHFKSPQLFAKLYTEWAVKYSFDGFLLDAEFKGDDEAFVAFLNVVGDSLHAAGKAFGVFLYPSMDKAKYVNGLASVDHWLGTWGGKCSTIPNVLWALHHDNNVSHSKRANLMLYPRDASCGYAGITETFTTLVQSEVEEIGFWANDGYLGDTWHSAMASYLSMSPLLDARS